MARLAPRWEGPAPDRPAAPPPESGPGGPPGAAPAWWTEALEALTSLGRRLQAVEGPWRDPRLVLESTLPVLERLLETPRIAFLMVEEDGFSFEPVLCPLEHVQALEAELEHQGEAGIFGWAIYRNGAVVVPGTSFGDRVLLHVLSTPNRVVGMLVAGLDDARGGFVPDVAQKFLSLVLLQAAWTIDVEGMRRKLEAQNRELEARVEERTAELRASEERARQADRAKSEFLAAVGHEIRTPLSGILLNARKLASAAEDPDEGQLRAGAIRQSVEMILRHLKELLDLSRVEAGEMPFEESEFDLVEVVEDAVQVFGHQAAERRVEVGVAWAPGVPRRVRGDAMRVGQVVANLVGNAVKFTEEGWVRVDILPAPGLEGVEIRVADTGPGIPEHRLEAIFDRFTQADSGTVRRFGGSGLGLAITRGLAQRMGGDCTVSSRVGEGTTFTVTLGLAPVPVPAAPPGSLRGRTVLLAGPRTLLPRILAERIRQEGGRVETVEPGEALVRRRGDGNGRGDPVSLVVLNELHGPLVEGCLTGTDDSAGGAPVLRLVWAGSGTDREEGDGGWTESVPLGRTELERIVEWLRQEPAVPPAEDVPGG